ncbi:MAG: DUF6631 family protein [Luteibacter sp.]
MARKVTPSRSTSRPAKTTAAAAGTDDLAVLHPEITVPIKGEFIVVREYGLVEGLKVRYLLGPFNADLHALFDKGPFLTDDVIDLFGAHVDLIMEAVAIAIDKPVAWVRGLDEENGNTLLMAWWGVQGPFFLRQIVSRKGEKMRLAVLAGVTSTSNSSPPASEHLSK